MRWFVQSTVPVEALGELVEPGSRRGTARAHGGGEERVAVDVQSLDRERSSEDRAGLVVRMWAEIESVLSQLAQIVGVGDERSMRSSPRGRREARRGRCYRQGSAESIEHLRRVRSNIVHVWGGAIDGDRGDAVRGEQVTRTIRNREAPVSGPQLA